MIATTPPGQAAPSAAPVSFTQEGYFRDLEQDFSFPNHLQVIRLLGDFRQSAITQAVQRLMERHEILHICFPQSASGRTMLVIPPVANVEEVDCCAMEVSNLELPPVAKEFAQRAFDLRSSAGFRVRLARISSREALLIMSLHHAITDRASQHVLFTDACTLLRASSGQRSVQLPGLPLQFRDYALLERQAVAREVATARIRLANRQISALASVAAGLHAAAIGSPPSSRQQSASSRLPKSVRDALIYRANQERVTPFAIALSCFTVLLGKWTRSEVISIRVPVVARPHIALRGIIGPFADEIVISVDLRKADTYRQLFWLIHASMPRDREASDHCISVMEEASREAAPRISFMSSIPCYRDIPKEDARAVQVNEDDLRISLYALDECVLPALDDSKQCRSNLHAELAPVNDGLTFRTDFDTTVFDPESVAAQRAQFSRLLESAVIHSESEFRA